MEGLPGKEDHNWCDAVSFQFSVHSSKGLSVSLEPVMALSEAESPFELSTGNWKLTVS
jgi:hypothetical protein